MIYIDVSTFTPDSKWLEKAKKVTDKLLTESDHNKRLKIIDQNRRLWKQLAKPLSKLSSGKCWYSEGRVEASHMDVDHYRPKGGGKGLDKKDICEGYWWLAFDYRNYRFVGSKTNRDFKKDMFPLKIDTKPAQINENLEDESPYFLDPTVFTDTILLAFDELGNVICTTDEDWDKERVKVTVTYYKLDDETIKAARISKWQECQEIIDKILIEYKFKGTGVSKGKYMAYVDELRKLTNPNQPYSSVARSFIMVKSITIPWLLKLLT